MSNSANCRFTVGTIGDGDEPHELIAAFELAGSRSSFTSNRSRRIGRSFHEEEASWVRRDRRWFGSVPRVIVRVAYGAQPPLHQSKSKSKASEDKGKNAMISTLPQGVARRGYGMARQRCQGSDIGAVHPPAQSAYICSYAGAGTMFS